MVKFKDSVFAWVIYRKDVKQVNNFRAVFYDDSFHMALHKTWAVFMMILLTWHYIKQERYLHNSNSSSARTVVLFKDSVFCLGVLKKEPELKIE